LVKGGGVVLDVDDLAGLVWFYGCGGNDFRRGERAAFGNGRRAGPAGVAGGGGFLCGAGGVDGGRRCLTRDVEDVEFATGGGLCGVVFGRVVRDVVAVDDVVVPVALALLEGAVLEFEAPEPAAGLLGVLRERELAGVVVPGAEEVYGFAVGACAEGEVELDCGHFGGRWCLMSDLLVFLVDNWLD